MKNILLLAAIIAGFTTQGQSYSNTTLTAGESGSFYIGTTLYGTNTVAIAFSYNRGTYVGITNAAGTKTLVYGKPISYYKRSSGVAFADSAALVAFADSFMFSDGGGGGGSGTVTNVIAGTNISITGTSTVQPTVNLSTNPSLGSATATTQTAGDNSTKVATTAYVDNAGIYYTQVSLTSAQLLSLNTTPVQLVAAPGAGKYIVPIHMSFDYTYVSTTYTTATVQTYETSDKSGPITNNSSFLGFTTNTIRQLYTTGAAGGGIITYVANQPLMIYITVADPTTGNGTAKVNIYYKIVTQ